MRLCEWCGGPIPARARRDALTCSQSCRQARHRVTRYAIAGLDASRSDRVEPSRLAARDALRGPEPSRADPRLQARRFAYADPPYPGEAHYYRDHPDYAGEVDHETLIRRLSTYDGWALSTSASALPHVLALTVAQGLNIRVAAWIRGPRPHATARYPLNAWEPVVYAPVALDVGGDASRVAMHDASCSPANATRRADPHDTSHGAGTGRRVDTLTHGVSPMLTLPGRVIGAKPAAFCRWMFDLIGATPDDELDDLFPGSGMVGKTWAAYCSASRSAPSPGSAHDGSGTLGGDAE